MYSTVPREVWCISVTAAFGRQVRNQQLVCSVNCGSQERLDVIDNRWTGNGWQAVAEQLIAFL